MSEETLRKEFEEWATDHGYACLFSESRKMFMPYDTQAAWYGWLESARRADKRAREECVRTCTALAGDNFHDAYDCANAILATIKEE